MKAFRKFFRIEEGQSLAIFALILTVLCGFVALSVDVGNLVLTKSELQKAADAGALAGVRDLTPSSEAAAIATGIQLATANGSPVSNAEIIDPTTIGYKPDPDISGVPMAIRVTCSETVENYFAQIIGISTADVSADATAVRYAEWNGEALPFVNLGQKPGLGGSILLWDKEAPGDKESLWKTERVYVLEPYPHFDVTYGDGLTIDSGKDASVQAMLSDMWAKQYLQPSGRYYVLSLSPAVFDAGGFWVNGHTKYVTIPDFSDLKTKDTIDPSELVLLECTWDSYEKISANNWTLTITVTNMFDVIGGDIPITYDGTGIEKSFLIE
jgi:Flp pilus assembly protein TadG